MKHPCILAHQFKVLNFKSMHIFCYRLVGTPILGRPKPDDSDCICDITTTSPFPSAYNGRLGRGIPTESIAHFSIPAAKEDGVRTSLKKQAVPKHSLRWFFYFGSFPNVGVCRGGRLCPPKGSAFTGAQGRAPLPQHLR